MLQGLSLLQLVPVPSEKLANHCEAQFFHPKDGNVTLFLVAEVIELLQNLSCSTRI